VPYNPGSAYWLRSSAAPDCVEFGSADGTFTCSRMSYVRSVYNGIYAMKTWAVQEAKARFGELLKICLLKGPQIVTKRGVEAAATADARGLKDVPA
jgi:prevent-host-death family protein